MNVTSARPQLWPTLHNGSGPPLDKLKTYSARELRLQKKRAQEASDVGSVGCSQATYGSYDPDNDVTTVHLGSLLNELIQSLYKESKA